MEMNDVNHIRELFDEKLKPIVQSIIDLRQELKDTNYTALQLKVESLERSKEYYKIEYFNTVKRVDMLETRINKIDDTVEEVEKLVAIEKGLDKVTAKLEELECTLEKHELFDTSNTTDIRTKVDKMESDLSIYLLTTKYPRLSIIIVIALILLMESEKIGGVIGYLKNLF